MIRKIGKKVLALLIVLAVALLCLAGCGDDKNVSANGGPSGTNISSEPESQDMPSSDPEQQVKDYNVKLTFVNEAYIADGDESLDKLVTGVDGVVSAEDGDIQMACSEALKLLNKVPEGKEGLMTVTDNVEVSGVTLAQDGTVTVDLAAVPQDGLDSYTEQFLIYQIVGTLLDSFDEVTGVGFTVAGEQVETIGGHMDASSVYTMDDLNSFNEPGASLVPDEE